MINIGSSAKVFFYEYHVTVPDRNAKCKIERGLHSKQIEIIIQALISFPLSSKFVTWK